MKHFFDVSRRHRITAANKNQYIIPANHPNRIMREHDLVYMIEGTWKIGQDGECYELRRDDVLILEAGRAHYGVEACAAGTKTLFIHAWALETDRKQTEDPNAALCLESRIPAKANPAVRRCFERVVFAQSCGDEQMASVYFDALLYELRECIRLTSSHTSADQIRQLILSSDRILTNTEIAGQLQISLKTAEQTFKKAFGISIHQYQMKTKIESVKFYLTNFPEMKLSEIAANLGFYDEFHFSKQFRNSTGISPGKYRKNS